MTTQDLLALWYDKCKAIAPTQWRDDDYKFWHAGCDVIFETKHEDDQVWQSLYVHGKNARVEALKEVIDILKTHYSEDAVQVIHMLLVKAQR